MSLATFPHPSLSVSYTCTDKKILVDFCVRAGKGPPCVLRNAPMCVERWGGGGGTSMSPQRRVGGVFKHWTRRGGGFALRRYRTVLAKSLSLSATTKNEMGICSSCSGSHSYNK
jgi:hypothetical protein